jgi:uncharacterized protein YggE
MTFVAMAFLFALSIISPNPISAQARVAMGGAPAKNAESQSVQDHVITVSRSGEATAKPDLGILMMSIHSSSPIADEAVTENGRKVKDVQSALAGLEFGPSAFQISSVTLGQAGGGRFPGQAEVTAYEATQYVYVFFEGADLNDVGHLTTKAASVIEALRKAGAVPASSMGFAPMAQESLIVYTIKDPTQYENQALRMAISRARAAAQDIAAGTGVQLGGLLNVQSGYLGGNVIPRSGSSPLEGIKYRWFSPKIDELQIIANATLQYSFN